MLHFVYPTCCLFAAAAAAKKVSKDMVETLPVDDHPAEGLDLHDVPVVDTVKVVEHGKVTSSVIDASDLDKPGEEDIKMQTTAEKPADKISTTQQTEKLTSVPKQTQSSPSNQETMEKSNAIPARKAPVISVDKAPQIEPTKTVAEEHMKTQDVRLEASGRAAPDSIAKPDSDSAKLNVQHTSVVSGASQGTPAVDGEKAPVEATKVQSSSTVSCDPDQTLQGEGNIDGCHMGPDIAQIWPSSTEDGTEATDIPAKGQTDDKQQTQQQGQDQGQKVQNEKNGQVQGHENGKKKQEQNGAVPVQQKQPNGGSEHHIYAEERYGKDNLGLEVVEPPTGEADDEIQVTKKVTTKETTYMKLKNRIKELELNLNLSSR